MAYTIYQKTVGWVRRRTFHWTLKRRLIVFLVVADFIVLAVAVVAYRLISDISTVQPVPGSEQGRVVVFAALGGLMLGLITLVAALNIMAVAERIHRIGYQVDNQLTSGNPDIAISPEHEDEIGSLIVKMNRLGHVFRASLQTLARRADEMAMLGLVATTINQTLDLQQVLDTSLREALKTVKWDAGAIYMWDERTESLNMVSFTGLDEDSVRRNIAYKLGENIIGISAQRGEIMVTGSGPSGQPASELGAPGWPATQVSLPLVTVPGQLLGTIVLASHQDKSLSEDESRLLTTLSAQIALAIDKAQLYTKVSEHAVELEKIVAARTVQLSQAIDELWIALKQAQEADRVKSLLLSTVSHELRTPLATIKGNTSLLIEHYARIPPEQFVEHLHDIEEETDKLTELISNLLEMSRIEAGSLHIQNQQVDLVEVLRDSVLAATLRHKDHPVSFSSSVPSIIVSGDPRRIDQIVSNLVDNAAKYSPSKAAIDVRVEHKSDQAVVSIRDRGFGIAADNIERIFERFFQIKREGDSARHGIGLGLAICRGLVEGQGGRIWVESELDRGSTFFFTIPVPRRSRRRLKERS